MRLFLGDCLEVMKEIQDHSIDMVLADLPYGTTQNKWDSVIPLPRLWAEYRRICRGAIVLTASQPGTGFLNAKRAPLKNHESVLVFSRMPPKYRPQMRTGFKPYRSVKGHHGTCYGQDKGAVTESNGDRYPVTVIEFKRDREKVHPTQKPVALFEYLILTYTNEGETVLDNTMGSGSAGVAAVRTGRRFIGIEKDPIYFETAEKRLEAEATLAQITP
jgi:DNA modification methylase